MNWNDGRQTGFQGSLRWIIAALLVTTTANCLSAQTIGRYRELQEGYGKVNDGQGVNGVSILAGIYRQNGATVNSMRRISPLIDRYDTIVWAPDDTNAPDLEVINRLESWMLNGFNRRLVYIGRDYDSMIAFLETQKNQVTGKDKELVLRDIAEAKSWQDAERGLEQRFVNPARTQACSWFDQKPYPHTIASDLNGPWSKQVADTRAVVEYRQLLVPKSAAARSLLKVDGHDFAFAVGPTMNPGNQRIYVISNGSFLLNHGLVNHENRKIAAHLVRETNGNRVLFLESGPGGIPMTESTELPQNQTAWTWIAQPPLKYIVPQFLLWGLFFCFVFFPIFGRPKKINRRSTSNFRNHIAATAKLLKKTGSATSARQKIDQYHNLADERKHLRVHLNSADNPKINRST